MAERGDQLKPLDLPPEAIARTAEMTQFAGSAIWTGQHVDQFQPWFHARHRIVTASRMAALLGVHPQRDALSIYVDVLKPPEAPAELAPFDSPMFWGTVLEWPIAQAAAREYGWEIRRGGALLVSRQCPYVGATLDAEVRPLTGGAWQVYEGKTVSQFRYSDWEGGMPPDRIWIQAQVQTFVAEAPCNVFALVGGNRPELVEVEPDLELHGVFVEATEELVDRVSRLDPYPATHLSRDALDRLHDAAEARVEELGPAELEWTQELVALSRKATEISKRQDEIKNLIRQRMGSALWGRLSHPVDGKQFWKWPELEAESGRSYVRLVKQGPQKARRRRARRA